MPVRWSRSNSFFFFPFIFVYNCCCSSFKGERIETRNEVSRRAGSVTRRAWRWPSTFVWIFVKHSHSLQRTQRSRPSHVRRNAGSRLNTLGQSKTIRSTAWKRQTKLLDRQSDKHLSSRNSYKPLRIRYIPERINAASSRHREISPYTFTPPPFTNLSITRKRAVFSVRSWSPILYDRLN